METTLVSIIMPAFNASRFIGETIHSVLEQTYTDWELIVANDCSMDDTAAIVEGFAQHDERIILLNASQNGGVAFARNLALSRAKGRYIAFLDSDDCWMKDKLEKQLAFMRADDVAMSYTSYQYMDENSQPLKRFVHVPEKMRYQDVLKNTVIGCLTVMVDREQTGDFRMPPLKHSEDTMTWVNLLKKGFVARGIPEVLARYRVSPNALTRNKLKAAKMHWQSYRRYAELNLFACLYYFGCYSVNALLKTKKA